MDFNIALICRYRMNIGIELRSIENDTLKFFKD